MKKSSRIIYIAVIFVAMGILSFFIYSDRVFKAELSLISDEVIIDDISIEEDEGNKYDSLVEIKVYVCGEVESPGVVVVKEGDRVEDAIAKAGGVTDKFNPRGINLARIVNDEDRIIVPSIEDIETEGYAYKKIDVNTATVEQLSTLKGVGEQTAKAIIKYRDKVGSFKKLEDLLNISGIGPKKLEMIIDDITIN